LEHGESQINHKCDGDHPDDDFKHVLPPIQEPGEEGAESKSPYNHGNHHGIEHGSSSLLREISLAGGILPSKDSLLERTTFERANKVPSELVEFQ
jgi:hypothetical protein